MACEQTLALCLACPLKCSPKSDLTISLSLTLNDFTLSNTKRFYCLTADDFTRSQTPNNFTPSNARRCYSSNGDPIGLKGLTAMWWGLITRLACLVLCVSRGFTAHTPGKTREPACLKLDVFYFCFSSLLDENPVDHRNVKLKAIKERFVLLFFVSVFH